ncbi:hypothetical protein U0070_004779, partial [Myodes glareolus]
ISMSSSPTQKWPRFMWAVVHSHRIQTENKPHVNNTKATVTPSSECEPSQEHGSLEAAGPVKSYLIETVQGLGVKKHEGPPGDVNDSYAVTCKPMRNSHHEEECVPLKNGVCDYSDHGNYPGDTHIYLKFHHKAFVTGTPPFTLSIGSYGYASIAYLNPKYELPHDKALSVLDISTIPPF